MSLALSSTADNLNKKPLKASDLFSRASPKGTLSRVLQFPLIRIFIGLLFLAPVLAANGAFVLLVIENLEEPFATYMDIGRLVAMFGLLLIAYRYYCNLVEKRPAHEVSSNGALKETIIGVLVAFGIVGLTVALMGALGYYKIQSFEPAIILINSAAMYTAGSMMQELISRLLIFRLIEEYAGSIIAFIASSLIFGLLHYGNDNATIGSVVALTITSFVFVGPFMLTRRVWMVLGIHIGWNFSQTGIFGMPNSGNAWPGWIKPTIDGPNWLTGGAWGIEMSFFTIALALLVSLWFLRAVIKNKQVVAPKWRR